VRTLPLIDLASAPGASALCDAMRAARALMFWSTKRELWDAALERTRGSVAPASFSLQLDFFRAAAVKERRQTDHTVCCC
jgi:hypothetical protein